MGDLSRWPSGILVKNGECFVALEEANSAIRQRDEQIAKLREQLDTANQRGDGWRDKFNADTDEMAELRRDAARYRRICTSRLSMNISAEQLNQALDAAIAKESK